MRYEILRRIAALEAQHGTVTYWDFASPKTMPGFKSALRTLRERGLIEYDSRCEPWLQTPITLTEAGRARAAQPYPLSITLDRTEDGDLAVLFHLNTGEVQTERAADLTWKVSCNRAEKAADSHFTRREFEGLAYQETRKRPGQVSHAPTHQDSEDTTDFLTSFLGPEAVREITSRKRAHLAVPPTPPQPQSRRTHRRLSYQTAVVWPGRHLMARGPHDAQWTEVAQHVPGHRWSKFDQADLFPVTSYQALLRVLELWPYHDLLSPEDRQEIEAVNEIYVHRTT